MYGFIWKKLTWLFGEHPLIEYFIWAMHCLCYVQTLGWILGWITPFHNLLLLGYKKLSDLSKLSISVIVSICFIEHIVP